MKNLKALAVIVPFPGAIALLFLVTQVTEQKMQQLSAPFLTPIFQAFAAERSLSAQLSDFMVQIAQNYGAADPFLFWCAVIGGLGGFLFTTYTAADMIVTETKHRRRMSR